MNLFAFMLARASSSEECAKSLLDHHRRRKLENSEVRLCVKSTHCGHCNLFEFSHWVFNSI